MELISAINFYFKIISSNLSPQEVKGESDK